jgi:hypothetical protein
MIGIISLTPANLLSVQFFVLNFCFHEATMGNPQPIVNPPPVWPHMFGCTANKASTNHINSPSFSALRTRGQSWSPLKYSIRWHNFSLTLVVRNAMFRQVSGLARLVTYRVFATIVWKDAAASKDNFLQSLFTTKRLSGAAVLTQCLFLTVIYPSPCFF